MKSIELINAAWLRLGQSMSVCQVEWTWRLVVMTDMMMQKMHDTKYGHKYDQNMAC